ncbi:MAG: DUF302 domain-containing protein [Pseudomonadota bacterium]
MRILMAVLVALTVGSVAQAGDTIPERDGWVVIPTSMTYAELTARMPDAIKSQKMGKVTEAGPTEVAANRGVTIPGSRIYGVFNNKIAVDVIRLSISAMIEAPVRMYVTENPNGTATLSYKTPTAVFSPYFEEAGEELRTIAAGMDETFANIAAEAVKP